MNKNPKDLYLDSIKSEKMKSRITSFGNFALINNELNKL
jgi:hypothetical protein